MTLAEKLLQDFQALPDEKKRQVINFVEFLCAKQQQELEQMTDNSITENEEEFVELAK